MTHCAELNELRGLYKFEYMLDRTGTPLADNSFGYTQLLCCQALAKALNGTCQAP